MVDLEPRRLALLHELARRRSVTAVAEALHLTPTAVSQQLKVLEREAGTALLTRVGRGVELTDAGEALALAAAELEEARARVEATWDAYRHRVAGSVSLSVYPTAGQALLPGLLRRLAVHPELELDVVEADMVGDAYAARTDHTDVVLGHRAWVDGRWSDGPARGLAVRDLASEPLDVVAPPGHRLAGLTEVTVADVAEETWVGVPVGWPFDRALVAWFAAADRLPRVGHRYADLRIQEALVAAGHGVALMPRQAVEHAVGDAGDARLVLRPVRPERSRAERPVRRIAALSRPDRAVRVAVAAVLDALSAEAAEVPGWDPPAP